MNALAFTALAFSLYAFIFGVSAHHKANKLEAELKRLKILDEKSRSDT